MVGANVGSCQASPRGGLSSQFVINGRSAFAEPKREVGALRIARLDLRHILIGIAKPRCADSLKNVLVFVPPSNAEAFVLSKPRWAFLQKKLPVDMQMQIRPLCGDIYRPRSLLYYHPTMHVFVAQILRKFENPTLGPWIENSLGGEAKQRLGRDGRSLAVVFDRQCNSYLTLVV